RAERFGNERNEGQMGVHHCLPVLVGKVLDEAWLVHAGGNHELVDAPETLEPSVEHRLGVIERVRPPHDRLDFAADLAHLGGNLVELGLRARCKHELAAKRAERDRTAAPESARGGGEDRDLSFVAEQRKGMAQLFGDHGLPPHSPFVPAQAGTQGQIYGHCKDWVPASAGTNGDTSMLIAITAPSQIETSVSDQAS